MRHERSHLHERAMAKTRSISNQGQSSLCSKIYEFAGNFVEEVEPELKELETESGNEGASHWSILGWAGLCTCVVVLTCVIGYFKKSIE